MFHECIVYVSGVYRVCFRSISCMFLFIYLFIYLFITVFSKLQKNNIKNNRIYKYQYL